MVSLGLVPKVRGSAFFWKKGTGGTTFSARSKYILSNFEHFGAQKVPKSSAIAQNSLLGLF
jgi:hypothetical protein